MQQLLTIAFLCFTTLHCALGDVNSFNITGCIAEEGYENSFEIARAFMEKRLDTMPDVSRDKIACALACAYKKNNMNNNRTIDAAFATFTSAMVIEDDLKKQMLDTINTCKTQAENNNCKFLQCIKATEAPFVEVIVFAVNVPKEAISCIKKTGVTSEDFHKLEKNIYHSEPVDDAIKEKIACLLGCSFWKTMKPDVELSSVITDAINSDANISADTKKTMLDRLNACSTQVESNKKNCKLLQCLKIFDAPFVSIASAIQKKTEAGSV